MATKMGLNEVLSRLENNDIVTQLTMLDGEFNQVNCTDNPNIPLSTWFLIEEDGSVMVDEDFEELYPL